MKFLELKIPPAIVFLLFGVFLWLTHAYLPLLNTSIVWDQWIVKFLTVTGILVSFAGLFEFHRAKTSADPMKPDSASKIVSSGIYRFTRNPMYLGMFLLMTAFAIAKFNILSAFLLIGFVVYMNRFQIIPEEEVLTKKFGEQYVTYKKSVRRWI